MIFLPSFLYVCKRTYSVILVVNMYASFGREWFCLVLVRTYGERREERKGRGGEGAVGGFGFMSDFLIFFDS